MERTGCQSISMVEIFGDPRLALLVGQEEEMDGHPISCIGGREEGVKQVSGETGCWLDR